MKEIIVKAWCDACWQDGEQRTPSTRTYTLGIVAGDNTRPGLKVLEVCDIHDKIAVDLLELLSNVGAVPDFNKPASKPTAAASVNPGSRIVDCPVCKVELARGGLVSHIWSSHRNDTRPDYGHQCPECRAQYPSGQGLGAHRRAEHGYDAVADALSGVKGYRGK